MTVDDRLRAAHALVPEPDEATIARARALLLAAMAADAGARTPRADAERRTAAGASPGAGYERRTAAGAAAERGAAAGTLRVGGSPRRAARLRPLRLAMPFAALALAALAAFALLPKGAQEPAGVAPERTAAAVAGSVLYQRNTFHMSTMLIGADGRPALRPSDAAYAISRSVPEEIWLAPDGSGRVAYGEESEPYLPSPADERAWRAAGSPDLADLMGPPGRWGPKRTDYGPGEFEAALLSAANLDAVLPDEDRLSVLPRDAPALRDFLRSAAHRQRPDGPEQLVRDTFAVDALTFLQYPGTPPELRAALLEVLRGVPGTRDLGEITDSAGRKVTAFQLPEDMEGGPVIAYDRASSTLMARGMRFAGGVRWNMTYRIAAAGVGKIGHRP